MNSDQEPQLRLILEHTTKRPDVATTATAWNPEDELVVHLELTSKETLRADSITIYFDGADIDSSISPMENSSLSAVSLSAKKAESDASSRVPWTDQSNFKFLSQAHDILQTNVSRRDSPRGRFVSEAPFHFIISRTIPSTNSEAPEQCLRLPRSLDLGDGYIDPSRGKRFAHPSITFYLRAVVTVFTAGHEDPKSVETFLPVISPGVQGARIGNTAAITTGQDAKNHDTDAVMELEFEAKNSSSSDVQKVLRGLRFTLFSLTLGSFEGPHGNTGSIWKVKSKVNTRLKSTQLPLREPVTLYSGIRVAPASLTVIHTPPGKTETPEVEPVREGFLQYRRESESSWFGDDSLEDQQDPATVLSLTGFEGLIGNGSSKSLSHHLIAVTFQKPPLLVNKALRERGINKRELGHLTSSNICTVHIRGST
ncbi:uncharacterized protein PAC_10059 [Phialocephala subalpina]|uniref:Uncharacterized protein n=1 Tax=Phialocephala subalpina TaxID=576137 RepID=A0A1L7X561_9HELO|nr:uncharacterized protein PAC_10059 [Phialocephala subalpina]